MNMLIGEQALNERKVYVSPEVDVVEVDLGSILDENRVSKIGSNVGFKDKVLGGNGGARSNSNLWDDEEDDLADDNSWSKDL